MASGDETAWQQVGAAIADRLNALRITKAEFIERSGISDKTLNRYLAGEPIKRVDKERELCAALGWTDDSVQRILEGGEPIVTIPDQLDQVLARLDAQDAVLAEILTALRGLKG